MFYGREETNYNMYIFYLCMIHIMCLTCLFWNYFQDYKSIFVCAGTQQKKVMHANLPAYTVLHMDTCENTEHGRIMALLKENMSAWILSQIYHAAFFLKPVTAFSTRQLNYHLTYITSAIHRRALCCNSSHMKVRSEHDWPLGGSRVLLCSYFQFPGLRVLKRLDWFLVIVQNWYTSCHCC